MQVLTILLVALGVASAGLFRRPRLDGRIVGGRDVDIEDFPHQLSLRSYGSHICGASIISENWVLTAAHCVDGSYPKEVSFRAGSTYSNKDGSIHQAVKIIVHPKYDPYAIDFDFAVVQVSTPFPVGTSGVNAISLATSEPTSGVVTVSGWGTTSSGGSLPAHLKAVDVNLVTREECDDAYGSITERMICAAASGKDSCQGDSGGPLIMGTTQVGVVSWGAGCAQRGYPGVYSNIANQRQWIKEQTGV